jgi:hypothetical protein
MSETVSAIQTLPTSIWATSGHVANGPVNLTAADPHGPVAYEGDETLVLDPRSMTIGQRYAVRIAGQNWWAIKRDPDRIDFRRK